MKIDVLDHSTASILVFRMMCQLEEKQRPVIGDLRKMFNMAEDNNDVDIKITVNGVEVDAVECLNTCWANLERTHEDRAYALAREMISLSGLSDIEEKIRDAEREINNAVDDALNKLRFNFQNR